MKTIISQTIETDSIHEVKRDLNIEEIFWEKLKDEAYAIEHGLTTMGIDEEIGLWEELEHRFSRRLQINRTSNSGGNNRDEC
jgi:hypothetical protein